MDESFIQVKDQSFLASVLFTLRPDQQSSVSLRNIDRNSFAKRLLDYWVELDLVNDRLIFLRGLSRLFRLGVRHWRLFVMLAAGGGSPFLFLAFLRLAAKNGKGILLF